MNRLPIRVRLTAAFATAMLLMLGAAALFVYLRLRADLNDAVNASLRARAQAAVAAHRDGTHIEDVALEDPEESFVQVMSAEGDPIESGGSLRGPALTASEVRRATRRDLVVERRVAGIDGAARLLARSSQSSGDRVVIVVGQSLNDRNEALEGLVTSFLIGGAVAVLFASGIGYGLASAGLAPVEAMRRRARGISLTQPDVALPLPRAHDEVRRLGETLNEMLARLRDSFDREARFVADASHELRTPVAVIKTELDGALRVGGYGPEVRDALLAASSECDRLARLADDLLVIARAADGRLPLQLESVCVHDLLVSVREQFVDRAAERGRFVAVEVVDHLRVDADPQRLRQVVTNLLDNALRHGEGDVSLRATRQESRVQIEVRDDGGGFAPGFVAHAFERFTRGDPARTGGGAGLGLAIVDTIVRAHNGHASVLVGPPGIVRVWLPATHVS